jgi:ABC-type multidrug transport system fused ATPase/permease subunit
LNIEPDIQDKPNAIVASRLKGEIIFDHVSFCYEEGHFILRDVSFRLAPGQRLALVGPSGAGKSTIASLILRLYEPQTGSILIDGIAIKEYQRQSLRQQIGLVLQDSIFFGATIRENISYGDPETTLAQIEAAARQAHAHDFIMALPDGYETRIGEMGSTLSGGQRQRLAIARALIKEPSILILDEPTSALDAASKAMVEETLNYLQHGKSTLVIAHNLATIKDFDQILVLDKGQIVERGSHDELMILRGHYYELSRRQDVQF